MRTVEPITAEIVVDDYELISQALFNRHLSRTFDKRTYDEGNVREGVVSILHGRVHRNRRRIENTQFRADQLRMYERELFPPIVERFVSEASKAGEADLFPLGELLAVVLAAKRAGFDYDMENRQDLIDLTHYVTAFSQASAIIDARDPDAVRSMVYEALANFKEQFGMPSLNRRQALLDQFDRGEIGEDDLPHDILTNLLRHRSDPEMELTDDFRIIREAATYLQGGTHTSSQTVINTFDLMFDLPEPKRTEYWERLKTDIAFAQRSMHETLRLRPTTPRAKRRAEEATTVGDIEVPQGAMVVLDLLVANRDPELFGADAEDFNPDREVPERVQRWGLSFGAGPHICPGRAVAGGLPQTELDADPAENHLFGLVPIMLQAIAKREPARHPDKPQARDDRTERFTRWDEYWVTFNNPM